MAHTHLPIGLWYLEAFFKTFRVVCVDPSFPGRLPTSFLFLYTKGNKKGVVIFPWKRWRTIGYSYIDGVEKIHTVLLLLLMRQDSICCCCRVLERRKKRRKITFGCYSFQLTGRRNENFRDFIFVVVVVYFSFENERLIDQPTLKLLGGEAWAWLLTQVYTCTLDGL